MHLSNRYVEWMLENGFDYTEVDLGHLDRYHSIPADHRTDHMEGKDKYACDGGSETKEISMKNIGVKV